MVPRPPEVTSERGNLVLEVLGLPHLVLADVCDDDGFFFAAGGDGFAPDVVDDVGGVEVAVVGEVDDVADGGGAFGGVDVVEPGGGARAVYVPPIAMRLRWMGHLGGGGW